MYSSAHWSSGPDAPGTPPWMGAKSGRPPLERGSVSGPARKVQSIVEWATPTSCCEARRFTGMANYYRRFVEGYAELAAPLTALGSPTARFVWPPETQTSFDALKLARSSAQVGMLPETA
jgi:hypothetical protein